MDFFISLPLSYITTKNYLKAQSVELLMHNQAEVFSRITKDEAPVTSSRVKDDIKGKGQERRTPAPQTSTWSKW